MRDPGQYYVRCLYPTDDQPIPSSRVIVIHDLEAPNKVGIARSLQSGWMRTVGDQTSAHTITDAAETVQDMDYSLVCWHCGNGNQHSTGREQVGYAGWSAAQWLTPDMDPVIRNLAKSVAWEWVHRVIPAYGAPQYPQWLSLAQLAAGQVCGLATHNDARLVWGGTTHWDPGPNYPFALLLAYAHQEIDKITGTAPAAPTVPTATPAAPTTDWFDMATQADLIAAIQAAQPVGVFFVQIGTQTWEHDVAAGTRRYITSPKVLTDRKLVLRKAGVKIQDWPGGPVDDPAAFGDPVTA